MAASEELELDSQESTLIAVTPASIRHNLLLGSVEEQVRGDNAWSEVCISTIPARTTTL